MGSMVIICFCSAVCGTAQRTQQRLIQRGETCIDRVCSGFCIKEFLCLAECKQQRLQAHRQEPLPTAVQSRAAPGMLAAARHALRRGLAADGLGRAATAVRSLSVLPGGEEDEREVRSDGVTKPADGVVESDCAGCAKH